MALAVEVQFAVDEPGLPGAAQLRAWAEAAWRDPGHDAEVVLRVTGEAESRRLNHDFRGRDRATNVLSFPFEAPPGVELPLLGDIIVCAAVVAREAAEQDKPLEAHWAHMVIHGTLHLLGYDHIEEAEADEMEGLEIRLLADLGYANPYE